MKIHKLINVMIVLSLFFTLLALLVSCKEREPKKSPHSIQIKAETLHKTLHFTGTIQPLAEYTLTSPMDAVVETMHYHFGQTVEPNALVFTLNSSELEKQYNDTLTDYLKAKDAYNVAQAKFVGTQDLWTAGLLSKNNYLSEKSSVNNARVSLMQSTRKLTEMLEKMGESTDVLSSLSFATFDKVRLALNTKHDTLHLKAKSRGVLLYPPKSNDDKTGRLTVGSSVKAGQVLALIGDLSGVRVEIDIPEVDIDKVTVGMPALIRSVAFPKELLKGELVAINAQASPGTAGTLPSFSAIVEVKKLSPQQQSWVRTGMSASIELPVDSTNKLMIPISAVKLHEGKSLVQVQDGQGGIIEKQVTTGPALADKVVIESGLNVGDVVLYD